MLGLPKNMNNTEGERAEKTRAFGEILERRTGLPVIFWDERLSTAFARRTLEEGGVSKDRMKQYVDRIAAVYILQGYLDHLSNEAEKAAETE